MHVGAALLIIALFVLIIFIGPIFTIWALNLIFGLAIPVTFKTWLSVAWLSMIVYGSTAASKAK